jgi:hypothetical protein
MDTNTLVTALVGVTTLAGGWIGGRRNAVKDNATLAQDTIHLLTTRLTVMESESSKIPILMERIAVLESLVTQRADVETVKVIVTRIEEKIDGRP